MGYLTLLLKDGAEALRDLSPEEQAAAIRGFRRLGVDAQREAIRGRKLWRECTIERAGAVDEKNRTAWISIASDAPYERWWGVEILDVTSGAIRDARLKAGAPLLVGHDTSDQVGVVENFEITGDRKLRVLARFGRSARAEEIFRDVLDGIRRNSSVGYLIHDLVLEKQEEDVNTYRVTDWEPLEGSLVAVPADFTVGVGRALDLSKAPPNQRKTEMTPEEKAKQEAEIKAKLEAEAKAKAEAEARAAANDPAAAATREQARITDILAAGDEFKDNGGPELARELIKDKVATVESFKARMFEKMRGAQKPLATAQPHETQAQYGEGARSRFRYGALKAFTHELALPGGKKMAAEEAAYRAGMWLAAQVYGKEWALKYCRDQGLEVRVMSGNSLAAGGALVPIEMEQAIIDLRDTYGVARKLARVRPMGSDQLQIPRRKGGLTAFFFNDDDGAGITASDKNWDLVTLVAKKLGALARVSRDLIEDAIINVVDDLAQEMAYAFAVKEDNCLINGDGTSTYGGMQGYVPLIQGTAYASRIALTATHDLFSEIDNVDLTSVMGGVSQYALPGAKFLCSALAKNIVFGRLKAIAGGNRVDTLGQDPGDDYLGYPIVTSEAMPAVTTTLLNKAMLLFGRFDLASSFGSRRGIEIQVLQERYAELGQLGIVATERIDIVVHDLGSTTVKGPVSAAYGA